MPTTTTKSPATAVLLLAGTAIMGNSLLHAAEKFLPGSPAMDRSASAPAYVVSARDNVPDFTAREEFGAGLTITVAWGDANNDGAPDLAVGNTIGPNHLHTNNGSGSFTDSNQFGSASTFAVVWGDYDNDGDLDVAVGGGAAHALYVNNGSGVFDPEEQFGDSTTVAMAWGDCDNDGDIDLAVGNGILGPEEQNYVYVNNGDGSFTEQEAFGMGRTDSVAWGDFDNDGDLDLAVGNGGFQRNEQNYLYTNEGNCTFHAVAEFGTADTAAVAWGDANSDGLLDLAVANWGTDNQNRLYINKGDGSFEGRAEFGARDTNTIAWADFDNDGDMDVVVGNGDFDVADQNYLYVNAGDGTFVEFAEFGLGSTDAVAWADVEGDGDLDLAVGNEHHPYTNYLYINNENDQDYLILHLVGHRHDLGPGYSNRDGIGARVSVYESGHICDADYLLGFRQIEATGGFSPQQSLDAEFGVPGHATVDIRIDWPGSDDQSIVQEIAGVAVAQRIVVDEAVSVPGTDCNNNGMSDECDIGSGAAPDCNDNGAPDECDVTGDTSDDCSGNGVPDECEPDCNNTGVADSCDILEGTSDDCSGNEIPDECEPDCNNTGVADSCDILEGTSDDCSGNGVPDECEPDCNDTGAADSCDILMGTSQDCNTNEVPDACDLAEGTSTDVNGNGVPDECDTCPPTDAPQSEEVATAKNRYLTIVPGNPGQQTAIRVTFQSLPSPFDIWNGIHMWVVSPVEISENAGKLEHTPGFPDFMAADLQCEPYYTDWSPYGIIHTHHEGIVPGGVYDLQAIDQECDAGAESSYSAPLTITASIWGDVVGHCAVIPCTPPDGVVGIPTDVTAVLDKFKNLEGAPAKARCDIEPWIPDLLVNIADVTYVLEAFRGFAFPFEPGPSPCDR
ncbi:MAG: CRTAC1 family protein [Phycisphaerales bacterium]|nr:MAG: CRTAC1 family protein [Phycisphaerales bacterium]